MDEPRDGETGRKVGQLVPLHLRYQIPPPHDILTPLIKETLKKVNKDFKLDHLQMLSNFTGVNIRVLSDWINKDGELGMLMGHLPYNGVGDDLVVLEPFGADETDIKSYAQSYGIEALKTMVAIMQDTQASTRDRLNASCMILDRAYGKTIATTELANNANISISFDGVEAPASGIKKIN